MKSLFSLGRDFFKVNQLFGDECYRVKNHPQYLDDIKPLLPSLASICVESMYEQAPNHVFLPNADFFLVFKFMYIFFEQVLANCNLKYLPKILQFWKKKKTKFDFEL